MREHIREKGYKVEVMYKFGGCLNIKTNKKINNHIRSIFPYKRHLSTKTFLKKQEMDLFMDLFMDMFSVTSSFQMN